MPKPKVTNLKLEQLIDLVRCQRALYDCTLSACKDANKQPNSRQTISLTMNVEGMNDLRMVTQSVLLNDYWYFQLIEPKEIRYTYKMKPAKDFGVPMNQSYLHIDLVPTQPDHACSRIENHLNIKNNIALVTRGECSFLTKCLSAESAGAAAIIITDFDEENDSRMIDMVTDGTNRDVRIPAFFMLGKDGYMIRKSLQENHQSGAVINIPINATGIPQHLLNLPPWTMW